MTVENFTTNNISFRDTAGDAGEAISFLDPIRLGDFTNLGEDITKVYKCDAANQYKIGFIGFAAANYVIGEPVTKLQGPRVE
jgi:hypothetical protein